MQPPRWEGPWHQQGGQTGAASSPVRARAGVARTTDLDRRLQLEQHWLIHEDLASARAEPSNLGLC